MGYGGKVSQLRSALDEVSAASTSDRTLIERWAPVVGLEGAFHFKPYTID